ncbi:hypothetical protein [Porphyromonas pogonae]|uniref:hypothetical protein n=1 Tax=Porphyromonas pogonae TaxID=867595 RepID=UPI002E78DFBB|nr:hypothetical protein [Porphyromonas pogonae]
MEGYKKLIVNEFFVESLRATRDKLKGYWLMIKDLFAGLLFLKMKDISFVDEVKTSKRIYSFILIVLVLRFVLEPVFNFGLKMNKDAENLRSVLFLVFYVLGIIVLVASVSRLSRILSLSLTEREYGLLVREYSVAMPLAWLITLLGFTWLVSMAVATLHIVLCWLIFYRFSLDRSIVKSINLLSWSMFFIIAFNGLALYLILSMDLSGILEEDEDVKKDTTMILFEQSQQYKNREISLPLFSFCNNACIEYTHHSPKELLL